jgi:pimeloyl-ACP methyl ester carboxylesterase
MMWFSTLYTMLSIAWYSLKGLFLKNVRIFFNGDTKVYQLTEGTKKALVVFHGISGTGDSGYIKYLAHKLKGLYDVYAPEYGSSDNHIFATYLPMERDPVYMRDVISLYKSLSEKYDQISFIAFSAGGPVALQVIKELKDDDIKLLNSTFFVSPAFKLEEGLKHLEDVWFPARWIMKFDYWKKHFSRIRKQISLLAGLKFWFSCFTFEDVFAYFVENPFYPILSSDPITELNTKFVLLHPNDDSIVEIDATLSFMGFNKYTRINQLKGGHIGFKALDRCITFYQNNENIKVNEIWDPTQLIKD